MDKLTVGIWRNAKVLFFWFAWIVISLMLLAFAYPPLSGETDHQKLYLPGKVADSHHQIAENCSSCHRPFAESKEKNCKSCHDDIYESEFFSHKPSLFDSPENAHFLQKLDTPYCSTCHQTHHPVNTLESSASFTRTDSASNCLSCHQSLVDNEEHHHAGMKAEECSTCHNFHDNRIAQAAFVQTHRRGSDVRDEPFVLKRNFIEQYKNESIYAVRKLTIEKQDAPETLKVNKNVLSDWQSSKHANAGVNCSFCHIENTTQQWVKKPAESVCNKCHEAENNEYLVSSHGIRNKHKLAPLAIKEAQLAMKADAPALLSGCSSCHSSHRFDTSKTVFETCLECHDDKHSLAYKNSLHFKTLEDSREARTQETGDQVAATESDSDQSGESAVSCATCHFPRESITVEGNQYTHVQHNVNKDLNAVNKFAHTVCTQCHNLKFSLRSLNDKEIMQGNFSEPPAHSRVPLIRFVKKKRLGKE